MHAVNAATGVISRASSQIATMAVTLYAARLLAPATFGIFAISVAWISLVRTTFYAGPYEYLLKSSDARKISTESLVVNLIVGTVLTLPILVIAPVSGHLFGSSTVGVILIALAPSNLIAAFAAWQEAMVLRAGRMKAYYLVCIIAEVGSAIVALAMLAMGYGLVALIAQVYFRAIICLLGFLALRASVLSTKYSNAAMIGILKWSLSRYLSVFLGFGTTYAADIALGVLLSPAAAGLYRASNRIVTSVSDIIAQPARMIAMTAFSAMAATGRTADRQWAAITTAAAVVGWSALGGMAVVGPMLVPAILGPAWAGAAALIPVLCAARATVVLDALSGTMLVTYDKQRHAFYLQVFGAVVMLVCILSLARYGVVAATWGVLIASAITSAVQMVVSWRHFPESAGEFRKQMVLMGAPVLATIAGASLALHLSEGRMGPVLATVLVMIAGAGCWSFCLLAMRRGLMRVVKSLRNEPVMV